MRTQRTPLRTLSLGLAAAAVAALAGQACLVVGEDLFGRTCKKNGDCPAVAGYLCVSGGSWPQKGCAIGEDGCVCEVMFPPDPGGIGFDSGMPVVDAGPPPDYCTEIKPLIDSACLGTCHSSQMGYPNSPTDFRLDYWEPRAEHQLSDGGRGLPGVKDKIPRIKVRTFDEKTMPPAGSGFAMTNEQRALVNKWVTKFGAPLGDGGCEQSPVRDAGPGDGGAPVSFSANVLPILTGAGCSCHTTGTAGGLSLSAANAYNNLVNANVSPGCATGPQKRVVANAPQQSQLWLKLANDPMKCNNFMPRDAGMPLRLSNPAQFDTIERWIRQGAPNN